MQPSLLALIVILSGIVSISSCVPITPSATNEPIDKVVLFQLIWSLQLDGNNITKNVRASYGCCTAQSLGKYLASPAYESKQSIAYFESRPSAFPPNVIVVYPIDDNNLSFNIRLQMPLQQERFSSATLAISSLEKSSSK